MKALSTLSLLVVATMLFFTSCKKDDDGGSKFSIVGTWKDAAYSNGSYDRFIFNSDKTYQNFTYDGASGQSVVSTGNYLYSSDVKILSLSQKTVDGKSKEASIACSVVEIDSKTVKIDKYTYFKE